MQSDAKPGDLSWVKLEHILGRVELKQDYRWNGSCLECYSWSIDYDENGKERSRTKPSLLSSMDFTGCDRESIAMASDRFNAKPGDVRVYVVDKDYKYVVRLFVMLISAFACGVAAGYFWGVWK